MTAGGALSTTACPAQKSVTRAASSVGHSSEGRARDPGRTAERASFIAAVVSAHSEALHSPRSSVAIIRVGRLIACIDSSLSEIPGRDSADYQAMGKGTAPQRAATAARWLRGAYERSASIQRVLDDAAVSTPEAAQAQTRMEKRRHDEFANACRLVLGGRLPPNALVDEVWALGSRAMWFKFAERGWSPHDWEA